MASQALSVSLRWPQSKRYLAAVILVIVAGALLGVGWRVRARLPLRSSTVAVGKPLPTLVVTDANGRRVDLASVVAGRRSVVVFYSPSCEVCQKELPQLTPFPPELKLIMVREPGGDGLDLLAGGSMIGHRFTDPDGMLRRAFVMPALPTILLIDEHGLVRDGLLGSHEAAFAQKKITAFAHGLR